MISIELLQAEKRIISWPEGSETSTSEGLSQPKVKILIFLTSGAIALLECALR